MRLSLGGEGLCQEADIDPARSSKRPLYVALWAVRDGRHRPAGQACRREDPGKCFVQTDFCSFFPRVRACTSKPEGTSEGMELNDFQP